MFTAVYPNKIASKISFWYQQTHGIAWIDIYLQYLVWILHSAHESDHCICLQQWGIVNIFIIYYTRDPLSHIA